MNTRTPYQTPPAVHGQQMDVAGHADTEGPDRMNQMPTPYAHVEAGTSGYLLPDELSPAHWFWIELGPRLRRRPRCEGAEG